MLPDTGHMPQMEASATVNQAILENIRKASQ
ncbi:UNVERIFIED_ORG: pimeloyl-ACP methyl ester carboxylesterase [Rhizobium aethiopicum]